MGPAAAAAQYATAAGGPVIEAGEGRAIGESRESPVPPLVARIFAQSSLAVRRKLVGCLLATAGPLAIAALAEGRFARALWRSSSAAFAVSIEDVLRLTEGQVLALARYAWEASPEAFSRLAELLQAEDPMATRSLAGALFVLALGMRSRARRRGP